MKGRKQRKPNPGSLQNNCPGRRLSGRLVFGLNASRALLLLLVSRSAGARPSVSAAPRSSGRERPAARSSRRRSTRTARWCHVTRSGQWAGRPPRLSYKGGCRCGLAGWLPPLGREPAATDGGKPLPSPTSSGAS